MPAGAVIASWKSSARSCCSTPTSCSRAQDGIAEGLPAEAAGQQVPKFRPGGLLVVHAGGPAGLFSAIIGGWANGSSSSEAVTREITP